MKKLIVFLILLSFWEHAAQDRTQVRGLVRDGKNSLENVHIKNITSGKFSVSNFSGEFELNMKAGDTLVLSHVGMNDLISFIKNEDLSKTPLSFRMTESSNELREVVVDENSEINAVSLGIIKERPKKLTMNERRLKTAGDFKPIHLLGLLGGSLQIDPILNAINGRTKKLKRNIGIEKKQRNIAFLEVHYSAYLKDEMKLTDQQMQLLINHVIEDKELEMLIEQGNEGRLELFLLDSWLNLEKRDY